ncbi:nuclear transport factor 2 family protein [Flagellimonas flava]|uniref:Ketosteroid isomerase-related protein n=1 Tax=Flagellimonas flava TaxID=570519 RepID=A0A1M5KXY2_9FLAO|nr:nuclear transport factor 2 family protein [Allomuricauda flava]SHG57621.1 Ketosteroid isomerase-related protein [Allomuricauda flava]
MKKSNQNIQVVENYFNAFQQGKIDQVLDSFHDDCLIVSVKDENRPKKQLHGTYKTKSEAQQFIANIVDLFDTKKFEVERIVAQNNIVFANGSFVHEVKATGKMFVSDWVQLSVIADGKIKEYRFYEDSAAFVKASAV